MSIPELRANRPANRTPPSEQASRSSDPTQADAAEHAPARAKRPPPERASALAPLPALPVVATGVFLDAVEDVEELDAVEELEPSKNGPRRSARTALEELETVEAIEALEDLEAPPLAQSPPDTIPESQPVDGATPKVENAPHAPETETATKGDTSPWSRQKDGVAFGRTVLGLAPPEVVANPPERVATTQGLDSDVSTQSAPTFVTPPLDALGATMVGSPLPSRATETESSLVSGHNAHAAAQPEANPLSLDGAAASFAPPVDGSTRHGAATKDDRTQVSPPPAPTSRGLQPESETRPAMASRPESDPFDVPGHQESTATDFAFGDTGRPARPRDRKRLSALGLAAAVMVGMGLAGALMWTNLVDDATLVSAANSLEQSSSQAPPKTSNTSAKASRRQLKHEASVSATRKTIPTNEAKTAHPEPTESANERSAVSATGTPRRPVGRSAAEPSTAAPARRAAVALPGSESIPEGVHAPTVLHRVYLAMKRAEDCHRGGRAVGTTTVFFTFAPDGTLSETHLEGEPIASAPVGRCVLIEANKVKIPKFEAAPFTVKHKLRLR